MKITLAQARAIIAAAFGEASQLKLKPLAVVVLDDGGHTVAFERQDGASAMRFKIAHGKSYGAIAMGLGSRALYERAAASAILHFRHERAGGRRARARSRRCPHT